MCAYFPIECALGRFVQTTQRCYITAILDRLLMEIIQRIMLDDLLLEHLDVVLEALEGDEDYGEVVERAVFGGGVEDLVGYLARDGVDRRRLVLAVGLLTRPGGDVPHDLVDLVVLQLVEDAVGGDERVVEVVDPALLVGGLGLARHDAAHAPQVRQLGLAVAERAADGETAGEDAIRADEGVLLLVAVLFEGHRVLADLLRRGRRHPVLHHGLRLVDVAAGLDDAVELTLIAGLVVPREHLHLRGRLHVDQSGGVLVCRRRALGVDGQGGLALDQGVGGVLADRADGAAVADVEDVDVLVDDEDDNGARACLVVGLVRRRADELQEVFLGLVAALANGLGDVAGELCLQDDVVVEVVLEVLGALAPAVAIVDAEDLQLGPFVGRDARRLLGRLDHVEDDRDAVFVGLPHDAYVRVGGEGLDRAEGLRADLARLEEGKRALRLILLQQVGDLLLDAFRGHLGLSARPRDVALGLLGEHGGPHYDGESSPLPHLLHEAGSAVGTFELRLCRF